MNAPVDVERSIHPRGHVLPPSSTSIEKPWHLRHPDVHLMSRSSRGRAVLPWHLSITATVCDRTAVSDQQTHRVTNPAQPRRTREVHCTGVVTAHSYVKRLTSLPVWGLHAGTRAVAAGVGVTAKATVLGAATVTGVSTALLRAPAAIAPSPTALARTVVGIARESIGGQPARRCGSGSGRTWIEVRGLDGPDGASLAQRVLSTVRASPGVRRAELHRPWSRVVVTTDPSGPTPEALARIVADAEKASGTSGSATRPMDLPGDDAVLAGRAVAATAATVGWGLALAGRFLRLPRLPAAVAAPVIALDYQPRLRSLVQSAVGADAADLLLAVATSAAYTLTLSPGSLAVEATTRTALVAETWSGRRAWQAVEPALASHAASADGPPGPGLPGMRPAGGRSSATPTVPQWRGWAGAAGLGALTAKAVTAGTAVLVAAPKATRAARELFAATLGRGLAGHGVLTLQPAALRRLDRVDAVVIDPRVLYTSTLTVSRVLGVRERERTRVWECARAAVARGELAPGWHPVSTVPDAEDAVVDDDARVLVSAVHDPFASALIAEARGAGVKVVSVDDDALRSLRNGFDDLHPLGESIDLTLRAAVAALQRRGATVAVVAADAPQTLMVADVGIGLFSQVRYGVRVPLAPPESRRSGRIRNGPFFGKAGATADSKFTANTQVGPFGVSKLAARFIINAQVCSHR